MTVYVRRSVLARTKHFILGEVIVIKTISLKTTLA